MTVMSCHALDLPSHAAVAAAAAVAVVAAAAPGAAMAIVVAAAAVVGCGLGQDPTLAIELDPHWLPP